MLKGLPHTWSACGLLWFYLDSPAVDGKNPGSSTTHDLQVSGKHGLHQQSLNNADKERHCHLNFQIAAKLALLLALLYALAETGSISLHQLAGSHNVLELHGSVHRNRCMRCGKAFGVEAIQQSTGVPHCSCGGIIKPDVVLYEESLNDEVVRAAVRAIAGCDLLLVGGTSLAVYPAAGLLNYYRGHKLVVINKTPTPADARATWVFHGPIAEMMA